MGEREGEGIFIERPSPKVVYGRHSTVNEKAKKLLLCRLAVCRKI